MKRLHILLILLLTGTLTFGQNLDDAVRFSRLTNFGSARSTAMGGAFGALGGDLSTLSFNPAGIGVFRKSEFAFTPYMNFNHTKSGEESVNQAPFQVGQLGFVVGFYSPGFDWKGFNFGITYNNLNNFNRKLNQLVGYSETSYTNVWALNSYGYAPEDIPDLGSALAYETKLIYLPKNDDGTYNYFSVLENLDNPGYNYPVAQQKSIQEEGYQGEYAFSFGTNYKDKLYLGMTVGIQSVYYKMSSRYVEAPDIDSPSGLSDFIYDEHLKINGVGTNLKFGVIYRPIPEIRIGAAIHTPTWYNLNYDYTAAIDALYLEPDASMDRNDDNYYSFGDYSTDYDLRTPWRAIVSLATVLQQKAILSVDYEYVNYTNAKYSSNDDYFNAYQDLNNQIKDYLRSTNNLRIGAEYRFNSIFSLRAGYGYQASPYKDDGHYNRIQSVSCGAGLNFGVFYCDASYVHKYHKNETIFYSAYYPEFDDFYISSLPVTNKFYDNEVRLTLGVRF